MLKLDSYGILDIVENWQKNISWLNTFSMPLCLFNEEGLYLKLDRIYDILCNRFFKFKKRITCLKL